MFNHRQLSPPPTFSLLTCSVLLSGAPIPFWVSHTFFFFCNCLFAWLSYLWNVNNMRTEMVSMCSSWAEYRVRHLESAQRFPDACMHEWMNSGKCQEQTEELGTRWLQASWVLDTIGLPSVVTQSAVAWLPLHSKGRHKNRWEKTVFWSSLCSWNMGLTQTSHHCH